MSFSPFSFCLKFDYFQSKWRVARYKTTLKKLCKFEYNEEFKIWFFSVLSSSASRLFFFTCFFYSVVDEWRNYFTSVIGQYNRLLSKIGRFKTSGEFSITNSLKFGFSLFCRVLLLAFFSYLFFFVFFCFFCSFQYLFTIEKRLAIFSDRQQI